MQALVELNDVPRDALSERRGGADVPAVTLALIVVYIAEEKQHREHCNVSVICVSALRSVWRLTEAAARSTCALTSR